MRFTLALVTLTAIGTSAAYKVPSLTPDNYDELTEGKTVFIKFFAPWCGHCKNMASDWERLAEDFKGHKVGFVAEVDCTAEGKTLCDENLVRGFPTLKWGDAAGLEEYTGGRDYDDLSNFAEENLTKPICSVSNMDLCDAKKRRAIERYLELPLSDISSKIAKEEQKLEEAEADFAESVAKLQAEYQQLSEEKEATVEAVKEAGLSILKSVKAFKLKQGHGDEL